MGTAISNPAKGNTTKPNPWLAETLRGRFEGGYLRRLQLAHPIVQAPMAGANDTELALAVCQSGGLGGLPAGMLSVEQLSQQLAQMQQSTSNAFAVNFFCHEPPQLQPDVDRQWLAELQHYYQELGIAEVPKELTATRHPFADQHCELLLAQTPSVVSFHYGLPQANQVQALKKAGWFIQSTATTLDEARWLEQHGADAIIAQGLEAGGHRGHFLSANVDEQLGTMALLPQVVDAVSLPVIAAGGIADARGIAAALLLGASAVQLGTRYLFCTEARIGSVYQQALAQADSSNTRVTNVISGRPARGLRNRLIDNLGPVNTQAPSFPLGSSAIGPLRSAAENNNSGDFSPLWAGQAVGLSQAASQRGESAMALTLALQQEALQLLGWAEGEQR